MTPAGTSLRARARAARARRSRRRHRRVSTLVTMTAVGLGCWLVLAGVTPHEFNTTPARLPTRTFDFTPPASRPPNGPAVLARDITPITGAAGCRIRPGRSRLIIPSLCISAPVVASRQRPDGTLAVPRDSHSIGSWTGGAPLVTPSGTASGAGTTLMAGHVAAPRQPVGALISLYRIRAGATVYATSRGRVTAWRVTAIASMPQADLPATVWAGRIGSRRLVIVTCGGPVHRSRRGVWTYDDNVVVTAVPSR
jgi:hypothetical protein